MSATRLYTPELLGLAVELAEYPPIETLPLHGESRSPTCGSTVAIDIETDGEGRIARVGLRVRGCAVGQAAATIFARSAIGTDPAQVAVAHDRILAWLEGSCGTSDLAAIWPDLQLIGPAGAYPARHGAILNPWKAARVALSSASAAR